MEQGCPAPCCLGLPQKTGEDKIRKHYLHRGEVEHPCLPPLIFCAFHCVLLFNYFPRLRSPKTTTSKNSPVPSCLPSLQHSPRPVLRQTPSRRRARTDSVQFTGSWPCRPPDNRGGRRWRGRNRVCRGLGAEGGGGGTRVKRPRTDSRVQTIAEREGVRSWASVEFRHI